MTDEEFSRRGWVALFAVVFLITGATGYCIWLGTPGHPNAFGMVQGQPIVVKTIIVTTNVYVIVIIEIPEPPLHHLRGVE